ncbi:MAG TPA: TIGR03943 family protein [Anaerolineales bacterium]|nr:TIGR03943 family protein [Anaerolineales bacterium]
MNLRLYRWLQLGLMVSLGAYFAARLLSGTIYYYINERFAALIAAGAVVAFGLAYGAWSGRRDPDVADLDPDLPPGLDPAETRARRSRLWRVGMMSVPLVLGLGLPARPLGAGAIETRGLNANAPLSASGDAQRLEIAPEQRSILDWVRAVNYAEDPDAVRGLPADVIGFVYHDSQLGGDRFMVARFMVTCCAADAAAVAAAVIWPDSVDLVDNTWVRVRGTIDITEYAGRPLPLIDAVSVEPTSEPEHPYMYP